MFLNRYLSIKIQQRKSEKFRYVFRTLKKSMIGFFVKLVDS